MPFTKGNTGRPKGAKGKKTAAVAGWCQKLVEDQTYRTHLKKRLYAGECAPALESMLWAYAYGKPKDTLPDLEGDGVPASGWRFVVMERV